MPSIQIARWCALSCLVACSNPSSSPLVDAPPDTPEDPPETTVFVELFGSSPVFVRYRTNGGEWREPVDTGDGYEISVRDDYELVAACATDTASEVGFIAGLPSEGSTFIPCYPPFAGSEPIQVTGTMKQPGRVFIGAGASGETADWSFTINVAIGTQDLIALDDTRVAIRRDLEVLGPTALDDIDLETEGVALVDRTFAVDLAADEQLSSAYLWFTSNTGAYIPLGSSPSVKLPPQSVAGQFDARYMVLDAFAAASYRSAYITQAPGSPTSVEMLPRLEGIEFEADLVTWPGTLPGTEAELSIYGTSRTIHSSASAGFLAGKHELVIDTDIPGFDPAWRIPNPQFRSFSVNDASQFVFRYSSVDDSQAAH